ncbi:phage holin family protein [Streptomyces sp. NPDC003710]
MKRLDHLEHLDKQLVDELAQVAREAVRDELREQTRKQRRTAALYAASGATGLYAGAALALAAGLALALGLPGWAAALVMAAVLGVGAYVLRGAARSGGGHPNGTASHGATGRVVGGTPPADPSGGHGMPYPPVPPAAPGNPVTGDPVPGMPEADPDIPRRRGR